MSARSTRADGSRRRRWVAGAVAGIFLLLVLLGVLAIPFLGVPSDAQAAKADLDRALTALEGNDFPTARQSVADARGHVDDARDATHGLGGDVWSALPAVGTPVADARHLVEALDDVTAVAELGVELYPSVAGRQATLFRDEQVDRETLDEVVAGLREAAERLSSADEALGQVEGTTPIVGSTIAARRDEAAAEVEPLAESLSGIGPILDEVPAILGFEDERTYFIAMLNPAELRYSGGATLAFAPMTWDQGKVDLGDSVNRFDYPRLQQDLAWPKVAGNWFHNPGKRSINNATFAPSWSVSGEELLRGWLRGTRNRYQGVVAVDVVGLSRLFEVTGAVKVPGYGTLTSKNLVETLVGSYDDYYPDADTQDELNAGLIRAFKEELFEGGNYVEKVRALSEAAEGRHLAMYFRDDEAQDGVVALGLDGDLVSPEGDYLGVFTQNTNASKADFWQRRSVKLDVTLTEDGTARNRLGVVVHNDSPPYVVPEPDPQTGYYTRWTGMNLAAFVPDGVTFDEVSVEGAPLETPPRDFFEHDLVAGKLLLGPGAKGRMRASYRVPSAASVEESGDLTYRLAMDPQGTVVPQSVEVTVRLPEGFRSTDLPEGWYSDGRLLTYSTDAFDRTEEWTIPVTAGS